MPSSEVKYYQDTIRNWASKFPSSSIKFSENLNPMDEYGSEIEFIFEPSKPNACSLKLWLVANGIVYTGLSLDLWSQIANRYEIPYSKLGLNTEDFVALFIEPTNIALEQLLAICEAVSQGGITLHAALLFGKLIGTRGYIELPTGKLHLNGVGGLLAINQLLSLVNIGKVFKVNYESWI